MKKDKLNNKEEFGFFYPKYNINIRAKTQEEANKKLKNILKSKK